MAIPSATHKVGLVVDRHFGERIRELARSFHLWVVESPVNTSVAREVWREEQARPSGDPLGSGVTTFQAGSDESPEDVCARLAGDLDEHHGGHAHTPGWTEIEVFGAALNPRLQQVFGDVGATSFEPTPSGFICKRTR